MNPLGNFAFVLHTHLPYSRNAGRWPHGEEWLYEAICETYLPLISMLRALPSSVKATVTISLTPVLLEQLAVPEVVSAALEYINDRERRAAQDINRFLSMGDVASAALAKFYRDWYGKKARILAEELGGDIVGAFRDLANAGRLEIIASSATHSFLPLLSRDSSVYSQIHVGLEAHKRHLGQRAAGFWLPECGYRSSITQGNVTRAPIERYLDAEGVRFFFVESHAVAGGSATVVRRTLPRLYQIPDQIGPRCAAAFAPNGQSTSRPYYVGQSDVAAVARNRHLSMQVWSADLGYPGDHNYREFHKRDDVSGLQYWAISGRDVELGQKSLYNPEAARARLQVHARHFAAEVVAELERQYEALGEGALVVAAFDTELFGHWWFEGVEWLFIVLGILGRDERLRIESIGDALRAHPPQCSIDLPTSSWGMGGDDRTWNNDLTADMWRVLHECEREAETLVDTSSLARRPFVLQALRELMLAQSSDWPFLLTTGQASGYGRRRLTSHVERFRLLSKLARAETLQGVDWDYLRETQSHDDLYSWLEPSWFEERQGL